MKTKLAIMLVLLSLSGVAAAQTTVSIEDVSVPPGGTVVVPIMINNVTDAGSAQIDLTYDKNVVNVISVTDGQFDVPISNINNAIGVTTIGAFQTVSAGLNGNVRLADVTLKAVGSAGDTSSLTLSITTLKTVGPPQVDIPASPDNGVFTITQVTAVPTLMPAGLILLIGMLALLAIGKIRRK